MKILAVAEKPSVAKSVAAILGGNNVRRRGSGATYISNWDFSYKLHDNGAFVDFTVTSVAGHLKSKDFTDAHRKWHTCDPFVLFEAPIQTFVTDDMRPIQQNLESEIRGATELMIWTDCDREGEHIGSEIMSVCKRIKPNVRVTRARFSALIPAQIHAAARNTVPLDLNQAAAVEARMELDLRTGAAMTRLQTLSMQTQFQGIIEGVVSYGSCQFPTLGFVVERYTEVQSFVSELFWYIHVALEREESKVSFSWRRNRLFDNDAAFILFEQCVESPEATVLAVTNKPSQKWKPWPLTTVELQKCGSRLLRLPPQTVLQIAEKLYQGGFVSYPRTETDQYDQAFDFHELIQRQRDSPAWGAFARMLLDDGGYERPKNGRKNDKAHPPIHPVNYAGNLQGDDKRVYEFIVRRFLANCSRNATGAETVVEVNIAGEQFTAKGLVVHARNYLEVYPYDKWNAHQLPNFSPHEKFMPDVCELKEGQTTSPNLLTEADLVNLMDKNGIGTDATIAEHIAKILEREYVMRQREGRIDYLLPSTLGIGLVEGYNRIGFDKSLCKPHLRAETEQRMEAICAGQISKHEVVQQTCDEYRDLFIRTRQNMHVLINAVREFIGNGGEAEPSPAVQGCDGPNEDGGHDDYDDGHDGGDDHDQQGGRLHRSNGPRGVRDGPRNQLTRSTTRGRGRGGNTEHLPNGRSSHRDISGDDDDNDTENQQARSGRDQQTAEGGTPSCQCDEPAVEKTTRKEGPNYNRRFWGCAKPFGNGACGFFEWLDPPGHHTRNASTNHSKVAGKSRKRGAAEMVGGIGVADTPTCQCQLEARVSIARKEPNIGRSFYACPKDRSEQCRFFQWAEDIAIPMRTVPAVRGADYPSLNTGGAAQLCYSCQQPGHFSTACPKKQGAASGCDDGDRNDQICYECQQPGHFASSCPHRQDAGLIAQARTSRYSRDSGHFNNDGEGNCNGSGVCFRCGEAGHWASACTAPKGHQPRNGIAQSGRSNYTCFKCSTEGHSSRDCPNDGQAAPSLRGRPSKRSRATRTASGGAGEASSAGKNNRGGTRRRGRGKGHTAAAQFHQHDNNYENDHDEYDNEY